MSFDLGNENNGTSDWEGGNNVSDSKQFEEDNIENFSIDMGGAPEPPTSSGLFDPFSTIPTLNQTPPNDLPPIGSDLNYNPMGMGGMGMGQPPQKTGVSDEEILEGIIKGTKGTIKGSVNLVKYLSEVIRGYDPISLTVLGRGMARYGGIISVLSIPCMFFLKMNMLPILASSGFIAIGGLVVFTSNYNKSLELRQQNNQFNEEEQSFNSTPFEPIEEETTNTNDFFLNELEDDYEDSNEGYEDFYDDYDYGYDDDYDYDPFSSVTINEEINTDEELDKMTSIPKELISRKLLFDSYSSMLRAKTPNFNEEYEITDEDDEWYDYQDKIEEVEKQIGLKLFDREDDYEDVGNRYSIIKSITKGLMTIDIECTRPTALKNAKLKEFNTELTNVLQGARRSRNMGISTITEASGSTLAITVFTGEKPMVSLKDGLDSASDFMLDEDNLMPVVCGYNEFGEIIGVDMADMESILIAGKQRSGKSVLAKGIVSQMCQLNSPNKINLYIGDRKGRTSDWYYFKLPHVKKFKSDPLEIVDMLRDLMVNEADKRSKEFEKQGVISIQSYHETCPDKPMPWIYVLLDEMISLATDLKQYDIENSTKYFQEYNGYLMQIATKTPNLGIRFIGVPHEVKDEFIKKSFASQIQNRIVFKGSSVQVEEITGTKEKDFPYVLANAGECAAYIPSLGDKNAFFMKAFMLGIGETKKSTDEDTNRILDYQKDLWSKLEDGSWDNSHWGKKERFDNADLDLRRNSII